MLLSMKIYSQDNSLFSFHNNGKFEEINCVYVDDFLWAGISVFEKFINDKMRNMFLNRCFASIYIDFVLFQQIMF